MENITHSFKSGNIDDNLLNSFLELCFKKNKLLKVLGQFLVIRNQSLEDKYPDGLLGFIVKYNNEVIFNEKISIIQGWGYPVTCKFPRDLRLYGLRHPDDFIVGSTLVKWVDENFNVHKYPPAHLDFRNNWLMGYFNGVDFFVYHV